VTEHGQKRYNFCHNQPIDLADVFILLEPGGFATLSVFLVFTITRRCLLA